MNYGLVGGGSVSARVVYDALSDVYKTGDMVYVADTLIENKAVKSWIEALEPNASFVTVNEVFTSLVNDKEANRDVTLLILWDEAKPELMEKFAFRAADHGIKILDVSNGLTPIVVENPGGAPVETAPKEDTKELTYDELVAMPMGKLKQMASQYGDYTKALKTKSALAEAVLMGAAPSDEPQEEKTAPVTISSAGPTCTVVVVFPDGKVITSQATQDKVAEFFGLTS